MEAPSAFPVASFFCQNTLSVFTALASKVRDSGAYVAGTDPVILTVSGTEPTPEPDPESRPGSESDVVLPKDPEPEPDTPVMVPLEREPMPLW